MALIARLCVRCVRFCRVLPVPARLDHAAGRAALAGIGFYRRYLSARANRLCLYRTSCSAYAADAFADHGWREGLRLTTARLGRCGGTYTLNTDLRGRVTMVTGDGQRVGSDQLAAWLMPAANLIGSAS